MKCIIVFCVFVCAFGKSSAVIYKLTDEEYYKMPPLLALEEYDRCLRQPSDTYCSAFITYVSDEPSPLLHQMQEYSEHRPTHFNHTKAFYGLCIKKSCPHLLNNVTDSKQALEGCLNKTVYEKYKLKVRMENEMSCVVKDGGNMNIDAADWIVAIVCAAIIVCNIVGSFIDVSDSKKMKTGPVAKFFLCFSISRNWKKLVATAGEGQDPRINRLKGIHGIRAISMILVIIAHSMLPMVMLGNNPQFMEEAYGNLLIHIILNGTLIMQTFLIISSFLLIYNLEMVAEKHHVTWTTLVYAFVKRWLRITPSYALILALTATWLRHIGSGPLWEYVVVTESNDCRQQWWKHMFYINNYFDGSYCMPQTWYLATDTQLYTVGLIIYLLGKNITIRKKLLSCLFVIGLIIPALHTYFQDLDGVLLITPTSVIDFFASDRTFNLVYKRGHTNLAGYVIGIVLGYLVYHLQKTHFNVDKYKKWRPVFWALFPMGTAIILSAHVFYWGPRAGMGVRILTSVVNKPLFAACVAAMLLGMSQGIDSVYRGICSWGGWSVLSRLSYSAYLLHLAVVRGWTGLHIAPQSTTYVRLTEILVCLAVLTYIGASLFFLLVEAPLGELAKICLEPSPSKEKIHGKEYENNFKEDKKTT